MIGTIARKEITEMMRDGRFQSAAAIVTVLLGAALLLGWQHYRDVNAQHKTAQDAERNRFLNQGTKNPHAGAHYGVYAFKPKMPLSLIDEGVDPWVGVAAWLEAHKQNEYKFRPAQDATAVQRFGELTGATVLQILLPLTIILLVFPAISSEREQGTLRQLLSLGAKPSQLGAGKALGIGAGLGILVAPATAVGILALALSSEKGALLASGSRMAIMGICYFMYFVAIGALSLAVSALVRSSRIALVTLLSFWILNCLISPRVAADLAKVVYPTPSAFQFAQNIELATKNGLDGHTSAQQRAEQLKQDMFRKYRVSNVDALPVSFRGLTLQAGEDYGNKIFDTYFGGLWNRFAKQDHVHLAGSVVAPYLSIRTLSMALAGTDFAHHAHFAAAAEDYRRLIQRTINTDITYNAGNATGAYERGADLWNKVPEFDYETPSLSWVLGRQWPAFSMLLFWMLAALALAWWSTQRMTAD